MNNVTSARATTPQLGFDFSHSAVATAAVNKYGATSISELDLSNPTGIAAGDVLSRMVVDDRVLNMGMTTWRALLDRAITLGHTELYPAEDNRMGLRTPGLRFGPIQRMPELGPEYVQRSVFRQQLRKALDAGLTVKSSRVAINDSVKLDLVVTTHSFHVGLYQGRKASGSLELDLEVFPMACKSVTKSFSEVGFESKLELAIPGVDPSSFLRGVETAASQVFKMLGGV